jgi:predicted DNA-binding protein (MmcQ/YjbR family)
MRARQTSRNPRPTRRRRIQRGGEPLARLRAICMALPDAVEKVSHGEPTWFADKGRVFAMLDDHHHGAPHVSVWLPAPLGEQETLVQRDSRRYFRPPYVGHQGWVGVVLDTKPDWRIVAELVEQAYRLVAHPRLVRKLDETTEPDP